jgi:NAD(P)-dependent dehydrogenase (short-subunit alcohol dehydrogenase family)
MAVSKTTTGLHLKAHTVHASSQLTGRVAIITGAERGIGRGLAIGLARADARLVLNYYQSKADVNETIRLVREAGSQAVAVKGDIAISSTSHQLVTTAYETFGRLDAIVNNAGIHRYKYLAEVKEEDWEAQLAVNLKGPFLLSQRAVDEWRLHKTQGRIVNMSPVNIYQWTVVGELTLHGGFHLRGKLSSQGSRCMRITAIKTAVGEEW